MTGTTNGRRATFLCTLACVALVLTVGCGGGSGSLGGRSGSAGAGGTGMSPGSYSWSVRVMSNSTLTMCTNYIDTALPPTNVQGGSVSTEPCPAAGAVATCSGVDSRGNHFQNVYYLVTTAGLQTLMLECNSQHGLFSTAAYVPPWGADGGAGGGGSLDGSAGNTGIDAATGGAGSTTPPPLTGVVAITAGSEFACARLSDGTVDCWGQGTAINSPSPVEVPNLTRVKDVASFSTDDFACALVETDATDGGADASDDGDAAADGGTGRTVWCWGENTWGQLGDGTTSNSPTPVRVNLANVDSLTVGYSVACASADGGLFCWGLEVVTPSAMNQSHNSSLPVPIGNLTGTIAINQVGAPFSDVQPSLECAMFSNGTVDCPSLGLPASAGIANAIALTGSNSYACALLADGTVDCWGNNNILPPDTVSQTVYTTLPGLAGAKAIAGDENGNFLCALLSNGTIQCISQGPGANEGIKTGIVSAPAGLAFSGIAAGNSFVCAVITNGTVECWGDAPNAINAGQTIGPTLVVAPGSFCPALLAYCDSMSNTGIGNAYRMACIKDYNNAAPDEGACATAMSLL